MLLFAGTPFENPIPDEYTAAKSFFIDFFKGEPADKVDVEGLQYLVSISARDSVEGEEAKPMIHLRLYLIRTKRSGQKLPRVEVEEMGPRMDFRVGRYKEPEESLRMYVAGLPSPRGASPTEAATAYVYLMLNNYATGQILPVDGGGWLV